ncbi:CLUMA_CG021237, isoform A [Clunio marinus]|uniref:ornithine decarboxylase n=1 Tax=Clunio marinus TaxID=568069 RepID=A0A1J1J8I6_9DIPT|nr:CLUMA_CG021237, isoform A [Clunio marinus]
MAHREILKVIEKFELDKLIHEHIKKTGTDESFFIVNVGDIVEKFILWYDLMPRVDPDYAFKCNNHPFVVGTLAALGAGYDCASRGEIEKVLEMGVGPEKIVFAQTVKPVSHINYAKDRNVRLMTFDNEDELYKVKKHFSDAELLIRLRFDPKSTNKISFGEKFGCMPGEASEFLLRKATELKLNVKGVAFHIGVGCLEYEIFIKAIKDSAAAFKYGNSLGLKMDLLDIGGGYPGKETETITGVSKAVNESFRKYFDGAPLKIISEPGTYFTEKSFTLVANVHSRNVKIDENGDEIFHYYITDGIYQSFNMNSLHGVDIDVRTLKETPKETPLKKSIIWGRACDPHDIVLKDILLPELQCGEWLIFENSGSYRISTSTFFNGFPNHPVYGFIEKKIWETFNKMRVPHIKLMYDVHE